MKVKLLLDSDVLIDVQREHPPALAWFESLEEIPAVPGLVVMELIQSATSKKQLHMVLHLTSKMPVVWPTRKDCRQALGIFQKHHLANGIGILDSLIGACAVGLRATLCTFNVKHFQLFSRLRLRLPYER